MKDLESMKKAGINRAFIGNIGLNDLPSGRVKILTDEWWDILHAALKKATELKIDIGIFNSPGWSQSGGPWIKPEQSMRYLNSSEYHIKGPQTWSTELAVPDKDFQRVKVIACKTSSGYNRKFSSLNPVLSSVPKIDDINNLIDDDTSTYVLLSPGMKLTVNIETSENFTLRSLIIQTARLPIKASAGLFVKTDSEFKKIKVFDIDRSNPGLTVGFDPYAPVVITVPETKARKFSLVFTGQKPSGGIAEIVLSSVPRVERYPEKSLAKMFQTPLPYWNSYMWPVQPELADKSLAIDPLNVKDLTDKISADGILNLGCAGR